MYYNVGIHEKKNRLPVSDAVFKSLEVIIPSTTLFKSVRELKSEGKQLPLKLESQTGGYRESQFTWAEIHE